MLPSCPLLLGLSHMCYTWSMAEVASRELRNDTRGLLRRVEAGEDVVITVDGRQVAVLRPIGVRPRWISTREFVHRFSGRQADAAMTDELRQLAPDFTDELR
jgi:prevent-host-death family protein